MSARLISRWDPKCRPAMVALGVLIIAAVAPTVAPAAPVSGPIATAQNQPLLSTTVGAVLVCTVFALLVGVAVFAATHRRNEVSSRVAEFVAPRRSEKARSLAELALGDAGPGTFAKSRRWRELSGEMDVAAIRLGMQQLFVITAVSTVLMALVLSTLTGSAFGALLGLLVPFLAYALIRHLADKQRRLFERQLPDNLSVVAAAMRSGQPFIGALQSVVDSAGEPSKRELRRAVTDAQLGVPLDETLATLGERMKSLDFQHVALIATLQRETGGNTAEVVELVSDTIRERLELRQMVHALTSQGRLAGMILSCLPVGLLVLVSLINPTYVQPMFHTTVGIILLVMAGTMSLAGSLVIKKIVQIDL